MKNILLTAGVALSIILGFLPHGILGPKPVWWRWLTGLSLILLAILAFLVPTGGSFSGSEMVRVARGENSDPTVPVLVSVVERNEKSIVARDRLNATKSIDVSRLEEGGSEFEVGEEVIIQVRNVGGNYVAENVVWHNPPLVLPLLPQLEERARNTYFHVPAAWIAELAWFIAAFMALRYVRKRNIDDDVVASSTAAAGAVFALIATITGAIWAKFNWGAFWNWDPRQQSIFIVLLMYGAYFALRSAISSHEQRARVSSIYLLLLLLPVTFFMFVYPRLVEGLHPGAAGSGSIGPVIDPSEGQLDPIKGLLFGLGFFSLTMLFFWIVNVASRSRILGLRRERALSESGMSRRDEHPELVAIEHEPTRQN